MCRQKAHETPQLSAASHGVSVHLQTSVFVEIVNCPICDQFIGSRLLKPVAPEMIRLVQEAQNVLESTSDISKKMVMIQSAWSTNAHKNAERINVHYSTSKFCQTDRSPRDLKRLFSNVKHYMPDPEWPTA